MLKKILSGIGAVLVLALLMLVRLPLARAGEGDGVLYLPFDEGTGAIARDKTDYHNDAVLKGNPQWVGGKFGKALNFDGKDGYVEVPNIDTFNWGKSNFSVSVWVKPDAGWEIGRDRIYGRMGVIIGRGRSKGNWHWQMYADGKYANGTFRFKVYLANEKEIETGALTPGGWYHLVMVVKNGDTLSLYVNGELAVKRELKAVRNTNANLPLVIGAEAATKTQKFRGLIDEVRIYKRALTVEDVRELYKGENLFADLRAREKWSEIPGKNMRDNLIFYAPFEGSYNARIAAGDPKATVKGKVPFVPGYKGRGVLVYGGNLSYQTNKNLDLKAGTVSLWFKPVDWDKDNYLRQFFAVGDANVPGSFLWLYKYDTRLLFLVQQSYQKRQFFIAGTSRYQFKKGEWTHLTGTWNGNKLRLYVNGKYINSATVSTGTFVKNLASSFILGGISQREGSPPDTVLDEFYIFSRALSPGEIEQLYKSGKKAFSRMIKVRRLELTTFRYQGGLDSLKLSGWVPLRRIDDPRKLKVVVKINKPDGQPVNISPSGVEFTGNRFQLEIGTKALPPGGYIAVVSLLDNKQELGLVGEPFRKLAPPEWLGNTLGITDEVPQPWTPLVRKGEKVSMWGREYIWNNSFFPVQMTTQGDSLLARPIRLQATVSGAEVRSIVKKVNWSRKNPGRLEMESEGELGPLSIRTKWWMEYDGFAWCKLTIQGSGEKELQSLSLELPLRAKMATLEFMNIIVDNMALTGRVRRLSLGVKTVPVIWLGNETGGLQWSAETNRTWRIRNKGREIEVIPGSKEVLLKINLVDHAISLDKPLVIEFGLEATPVKPIPADWRERFTVGRLWWPEWSEHRFDIVPGKSWRKELTRLDHPLPYMNLTLMWSGVPEFKYFRSEWSAGAGGAGSAVTRTSRSLQDYWLWRWKKNLDDYPDLAKGIGGIYMDGANATYSFNELDGDAIRNEKGKLVGKYPLLGAREFQKRLYVMMQNEHPEYRLVAHDSSHINMMQLAFVHQVIDGEHLGAAGGKAIRRDLNYYHVPWFTLAGLRAEFMGWNQGFIPIFLTQVDRAIGGRGADPEKRVKVLGPEGIPASEHIAGMLLIHDILHWVAYMNPLPFARINAVKKEFGWDREVKFLPYWNNAKYVTLESTVQPVVCSLFRRPGKLLAVIMNNSDRDAQVKLTLNLNSLKMPAVTEALDAYRAVTVKAGVVNVKELRAGKGEWETREFPGKEVIVPVKDGTLNFQVKKRNFRIFEFNTNSSGFDDRGLGEFLKNRNPLDAER